MIKLLLLDIDGVITDGKVLFDKNGREFKQINFLDIDAIFEAKQLGLRIGFITGESGEITNYFQERFKPDYFYNSCKDKRSVIEKVAEQEGIGISEICFIGDSKHDLEAIKLAGLGIAPANAPEEIKKEADYVLCLQGGNGAIKEAVDYIVNNINYSGSESQEAILMQKVFLQNNEMMKSLINNETLCKKTIEISKLLATTLHEGRQVLFCGNGGSAADAQHLATELVSKFYLERKAYNAEALTTNTSSITAIANDYTFEQVFARQIEARGNKGDLLIGLTTSGNSANVVEALKVAQVKKMKSVVFTGNFEQTKVEESADIIVKVPSKLTPRIQEAHIFLGHFICELVEKLLYEKENE